MAPKKQPLKPEELADLTEVAGLLRKQRTLTDTVKAAKNQLDAIRDAVDDFFRASSRYLGGAVNGRQVMTYKPSETFQTARFKSERPDLADHFEHEVATIDLTALRLRDETLHDALVRALLGADNEVTYTKKLDVDGLRRLHPEVHRAYQTRVLKIDAKALEEALASGPQSPVTIHQSTRSLAGV
jgi:hypothetical protein